MASKKKKNPRLGLSASLFTHVRPTIDLGLHSHIIFLRSDDPKSQWSNSLNSYLTSLPLILLLSNCQLNFINHHLNFADNLSTCWINQCPSKFSLNDSSHSFNHVFHLVLPNFFRLPFFVAKSFSEVIFFRFLFIKRSHHTALKSEGAIKVLSFSELLDLLIT